MVKRRKRVRVIAGEQKGKTGTLVYKATTAFSQVEEYHINLPPSLQRYVVNLGDGIIDIFSEGEVEEIDWLEEID